MAKIADAFSLIRNGANIKQGLDDSGYPITRIETISDRTVDRDKMGYAGITDITKYSDYVLQDGDILMSHINSETHLGKVARYEKYEGETIIHGMNLLCLRPNKNLVDSRYAFYYLSSEAFLHQIPRITKKSVNQASFNVAALKELTFPISSMEVQQTVADILDKANELIALRKEQLAKLDELVKARFIELFGSPVSNPFSWEKKTLKDKAFQMLVVEDTPQFIPFLAKRESGSLKQNQIYVRRGTSCEIVNQEELTALLHRRCNYMHPLSGKPLNLNEHLKQLKMLYDNIEKNHVSYENSLWANEISAILGNMASKMDAMCGKKVEPNPLYPEECFEEFIARMIADKKKKIERVLDLT